MNTENHNATGTYKLQGRCDNFRPFHITLWTPDAKPYATVRTKRNDPSNTVTSLLSEHGHTDIHLQQRQRNENIWDIKTDSEGDIEIKEDIAIINYGFKTYIISASTKRNNAFIISQDSTAVGRISFMGSSLFKSNYELKFKDSVPKELPPLFLFGIVKSEKLFIDNYSNSTNNQFISTALPKVAIATTFGAAATV